jgi:uncharacterized lipoprotein YajG
MKHIMVLASALLTLAACQTSDIPDFERMNEAELAIYNQGRPVSQMIVCTDDSRSFSRVRRRRCMTVEAAYGSAAQAQQLGVLNNIPGFGNAE